MVDKKQVRIVIQVRSSIQSVGRESKEYCREVKKFVPEVWYITECCWAKTEHRAGAIERELKRAGYGEFVYLFRSDEETPSKIINYESFLKFIKRIKKLR